MRPTRFTGSQVIMPLGHTIENEEVSSLISCRESIDIIWFCSDCYLVLWLQMLEVVRLEGHSLVQEDAFVSRDVHLLQVTNTTNSLRKQTQWGSLLVLVVLSDLMMHHDRFVPGLMRMLLELVQS